MITISLCMIVKNEESTLKRCLDSICDVVDEIVIVDTGSSDQTIKIARQYTNKVYEMLWQDDFSKARNWSFQLATMQYCMWLDADDVLLEEDKQKLITFKQNANSSTNIFMMKYHTAFDTNQRPSFVYYRERIIKNNSCNIWNGFLHECIALNPPIAYLDIAITHKKETTSTSNRNLRIFEKHLAKGVSLNLREHYYYGRELYYHEKYEKALQEFKICIQNSDCWLENRIDACLLSSYCYQRLNKDQEALEILFSSFSFHQPRCEILCEIGRLLQKKKEYQLAIYWLKQAIYCKKVETSGAFLQMEYYYFIPLLELSVCYYYLNDKETAYQYHQMAKAYQPNHPTIQHNETYFKDN